MTDIEWQDPPSKGGGPNKDTLWAALEANPGRWAVYRRDAKSYGGSYSAIRSRGYETTTRSNGDGTFTVYVRKPVAS